MKCCALCGFVSEDETRYACKKHGGYIFGKEVFTYVCDEFMSLEQKEKEDVKKAEGKLDTLRCGLDYLQSAYNYLATSEAEYLIDEAVDAVENEIRDLEKKLEEVCNG